MTHRFTSDAFPSPVHLDRRQSLREALRDLRRETSDQLSEQKESHRAALSELEGVLNVERRRGKKAAEAAQVEIVGLRAELDSAHEELQVKQWNLFGAQPSGYTGETYRKERYVTRDRVRMFAQCACDTHVQTSLA